jgi:hypothetical protein
LRAFDKGYLIHIHIYWMTGDGAEIQSWSQRDHDTRLSFSLLNRSEELLRLHIQERDRIRAELATLRNLKEGPRSHFFARPSSRFVIGEVAPLNELQQINPTRL